MKIKKMLLIALPIICLTSCNNSNNSNERKVYLNYGDNINKTVTVKLGDEYTPPTAVVTIPYNFLGWYFNPAFTSIMKAPSKIKIVDDVYLYAKYTKKQFDVVYDFNGHGRVEKLTSSVEYGQKATYVDPGSDPDKYTFKGWYNEKECYTKFNFSSVITENTTMYARWKAPTI